MSHLILLKHLRQARRAHAIMNMNNLANNSRRMAAGVWRGHVALVERHVGVSDPIGHYILQAAAAVDKRKKVSLGWAAAHERECDEPGGSLVRQSSRHHRRRGHQEQDDRRYVQGVPHVGAQPAVPHWGGGSARCGQVAPPNKTCDDVPRHALVRNSRNS
eukprot:5361049-Prymnesium_polylepis.1